MKAAIEAVRNKEMGSYRPSRVFNIPQTTLERYTGCPRRNVPDFGRVFLMLNYTDITQNT